MVSVGLFFKFTICKTVKDLINLLKLKLKTLTWDITNCCCCCCCCSGRLTRLYRIVESEEIFVFETNVYNVEIKTKQMESILVFPEVPEVLESFESLKV